MKENSIKNKAIELLEGFIREELAIRNITETENLIEQGLSSLMVMKFSNRIRKLGIKIPFAKLMEAPTVREWKRLIEDSRINKIERKKLIELPNNRTKKKEFLLTDTQYAYWIGRDDNQVLGGIGCHAYLEIDGENIDPIKLNESWNTLKRHHPMLRARVTKNGTQEIMNEIYSSEIEVYDLREKSKLEIEKKLLKLRKQISHRKLKIEEGEVVGLSIALLKNNKTRIFLDIDLIVADVMSISILIQDLAKVYDGNKLEKVTDYTFQNYIEEKNIRKEVMEVDQEYWKKKIEIFPKEALNLPLKKDPKLIKNVIFNRRKKIIEPKIWDKIKESAAKYKITPSVMLLTCYVLILERWCNQETFIINMPLFDRGTENENLKNMIADFTNLLLIDYERKKDETFLQTMKRVQEKLIENVSHSSYSGVQVQRDIYREIGSNNLIAPVVFACNIDYSLETSFSREILGKVSYMISQTPQVWLDFQSYIIDDSLVLCWDSVDELFPKNLINHMFESLVDMIYLLSENNNWNIVFDVLPKGEKQQRDIDLQEILPLEYPKKNLI